MTDKTEIYKYTCLLSPEIPSLSCPLRDILSAPAEHLDQ